MKIFIGTEEISGIIANLQKVFTSIGCNAFSVVKNKNIFFQENSYDINIEEKIVAEKIVNSIPFRKLKAGIKWRLQKKRNKNCFKNLEDFDLYIYIWDSLMPNLEDIIELKKRGKKIFFIFIGSDARYAKAFHQEFPEINLPWENYYKNEDINKKLRFIRIIEKHCDAIFSVPDQAGLQVRPFYHAFLPIDLKSISFYFPDNTIPKIIHAPSKRGFKGTERIFEAVKKCEEAGLKFEFVTLENQPNSVVRTELKKADIVIDQIYLNGPGMLGLEAMSSGCALATKYLRDYDPFKPPACYIDHTDLLEINLQRIISDREWRKSLAYEGRKFVEQNNQSETVAKRILSIYENPNSNIKYDPSFFVNKFKLNPSQHLDDEVLSLNKEIIQHHYNADLNWNNLIERRLVK